MKVYTYEEEEVFSDKTFVGMSIFMMQVSQEWNHILVLFS